MNPIMAILAVVLMFILVIVVGYAALMIIVFSALVLRPPRKIYYSNEINSIMIDKLLEEMEDDARRHGMPIDIFNVVEQYAHNSSDIKSVTCTDPDNNQWMIELWGSKKEVVFIEKQGDYYASDIYSKKDVTNRNIFDMMESHYSKDEVVSMMKSDPMGTILLALECRFENEN